MGRKPKDFDEFMDDLDKDDDLDDLPLFSDEDLEIIKFPTVPPKPVAPLKKKS